MYIKKRRNSEEREGCHELRIYGYLLSLKIGGVKKINVTKRFLIQGYIDFFWLFFRRQSINYSI